MAYAPSPHPLPNEEAPFDVLALALDTQVRFLPYALGVFFVGLPLFVWAASFGLSPLSITFSVVLFALNWGVFYAALNWIRSPAAKDLNKRVLVHTTCGLLWSASLSLTALLAAHAGEVAPLLLLMIVAAIACLIFFSAPVLITLLITGPLGAIAPLWWLYQLQSSHEWAQLAFSGLCLVFAFAWILNRHLHQHHSLILAHERARQDQNQALSEARALAEEKDAVLRTLSETVRVNLNGLDRLLDVAEQSAIRAPSVRNAIRTAQAQLHVARTTIESTLDQEGLKHGTLKPVVSVVSAREAVQTVADRFMPLTRAKPSLELQVRDLVPSNQVPQVSVDPLWLDQILSHLLRNAIDYTSDGHVVIQIRADDDSRFLMIEVSDTGPGLSTDELELAMKPYARIDRISHGYRGAGLGLPLARLMTEAMDGQFRIISAPGLGTRVQLLLLGQLTSILTSEIDEPQESNTGPRITRILILQPDRASALGLREQIETLGHKAMITPNRDRAIRLLETASFDAWMVPEDDPETLSRGYRIFTSSDQGTTFDGHGQFIPAPTTMAGLAEALAGLNQSGLARTADRLKNIA
ncbi:MAG: sensor histidine kinase [Asticcacaulis sp.]